MNVKWFKAYLNNWKQYIQINNKVKINLILVKCGLPQGSILGPFLLFLVYINDLQFVSDVLDPIMLADDTNMFSLPKDVNALLLKVNNHKINQWLIYINIYIYIYIIYVYIIYIYIYKYLFCHKRSKQDDVPFCFLNWK